MITKDISNRGIGYVLVARAKSPGVIRCVCFLVDVYCLGIKNCSYAKLSEDGLLSYIKRLSENQEFVDIKPSYAKKFVESAVTFASDLGFRPHLDFTKYFTLLADVDSSECSNEFTFGKDGKPLFISGPFDTPKKIGLIVEKLRQRLGDGGFNYITPFRE
jgi:hypothetical protein